jgi:hypothetical protein
MDEQMTNTKIENVKGLKAQEIAKQFKEFVNQKPGFELANYSTMSSYKSDYNYYKKYADKNRKISQYELEDIFESLTPEELAHRVFDNRLYINKNGEIDYITGQYFPTEYQDAAHNTYEKARRIFDLKNKGEWN